MTSTDSLRAVQGCPAFESAYRFLLRRDRLVLRRSVDHPQQWWLSRLDGSGIVAQAAALQQIRRLIEKVLRSRAGVGEWSDGLICIRRVARGAYSLITDTQVQIPTMSRQELCQWQEILSNVQDEGE